MRELFRKPAPSEPNEIPSHPQKIGISYNGILSDKFNWNYDLLSTFEQVCDLRTTVAITNHGFRNRQDVLSLGETLALKKIGRGQESVRRISNSDFLEIGTNFQTGQAVISIDDQGLADYQLARMQRFSKRHFTNSLSHLAGEGLLSVLHQEKAHIARVALTNDIVRVMQLVTAGYFAYLTKEGIESSQDILQVIASYYGPFFASALAMFTGETAISTNQKKVFGQCSPVYFEQGRSDRYNSLNLFKKDTNGISLIGTQIGRPIVTLKLPYES